MTVGAAFLLSGMANVLVLDTPLNVLAFGMSNVIFSLLAAAVLVFLGDYGRFTGGLPLSNPYQQERHDRDDEQQRVPLPTIFPDPPTCAPRLSSPRPNAPTPSQHLACAGPRPGGGPRDATGRGPGRENGALRPTRTATDN